MGELAVKQDDKTLTLTRVFDAPKELVFSMFSNPEHLAKWWGPESWPATILKFEFKPGGVWHYFMQGPDGEKSYGLATFQKIDEPNSLSFIDAFSNKEGTADTELPQGKTTITFTEVDGNTQLQSVTEYQSAEEIQKLVEMGMVEGVTDTWNQLDKLLQASQ